MGRRKKTQDLVMDWEVTPEDRANWAEAAISAYIQTKEGREKMDESDLRDLLADLMHYADVHGVNFGEELETATMNFEAER